MLELNFSKERKICANGVMLACPPRSLDSTISQGPIVYNLAVCFKILKLTPLFCLPKWHIEWKTLQYKSKVSIPYLPLVWTSNQQHCPYLKSCKKKLVNVMCLFFTYTCTSILIISASSFLNLQSSIIFFKHCSCCLNWLI